MANSELKNLYNSISSDIGLTMYSKEDEISFHSRLIYSAIGIWMLTAFKDKNAKEDDNISKSHVTIVTSDVLNSFLALDPIQRAYFSDPNRFISLVKSTYIGMGFINSKKYVFEPIKNSFGIALSEKTSIAIEPFSGKKTMMVGLALVRDRKQEDLELRDYFLSEINAKETFKRIVKMSLFKSMSVSMGQIDLYDFEKKKWMSYSKKQALKYQYSIIRIDKLTYKIINFNGSEILFADLPELYQKTVKDTYFYNEIWRLILGCASFLKIPFKIKLKDRDEFCLACIKGYSIPAFEKRLLLCAAWPEEFACNTKEDRVNHYIIQKEFIGFVEQIFNHLSVEIERE